MLYSNDDFYNPYQINREDIIEVWAYAASIETEEFDSDNFCPESAKEMFLELKREILVSRENKKPTFNSYQSVLRLKCFNTF